MDKQLGILGGHLGVPVYREEYYKLIEAQCINC